MQKSVATSPLPLPTAVLWLSLMTLLAGCGQRGPLRLPDAPSPAGKAAVAPGAASATASAPNTRPAASAGSLVPERAASAPRP